MHVLAGFNESLTHHFEVPHAGGRKLIALPINAFGIFATGGLDGLRSTGKKKIVASSSILVFDHDCLAADHVGGAVQEQGCSNATCQGVINHFVVVIEGILHHHVRGDGVGGLVDVFVERNVRVGIDDAGHHPFARGVYHGGAGWRLHCLAHGSDLAGVDVHAPVFDFAVG